MVRLHVPEGTTPDQLSGIDFSSIFGASKKTVGTPSEDAFNFIKGQEAFRASPYEDNGALAIGYGTRSQHIDPSDTVNEEQADGLLRSYVQRHIVPFIQEHVKVPLKQNQVDALTSLVYNVGPEQFAQSRALKALNSGDMERFNKEAFDPDQGFTKVTTAAGDKRTLPGLIGRRAKEQALFNA